VPALPFVVLGAMVILFGAVASIGDPQAPQLWQAVMRFFYYVFLISYILGVGYRAAVTVARERQQQTLEPLLLLPIERSEILFAKLAGVLWHGWPWLVLLAGDIVLGTLIGAYHPLSAVLLCLVPLPIILFVATFGLLLSVWLGTVLRATLAMIITLIALFCFTCFQPSFSLRQGVDPEQIAVGPACLMLVLICAAAFVCWKIALVMFENRARD
jgi:ABC-type Na+ efflux pump permease subunit